MRSDLVWCGWLVGWLVGGGRSFPYAVLGDAVRRRRDLASRAPAPRAPSCTFCSMISAHLANERRRRRGRKASQTMGGATNQHRSSSFDAVQELRGARLLALDGEDGLGGTAVMNLL